MKKQNFVVTTSDSPKRGYNLRINVYSVKKNTLDLVGIEDINTASYKGNQGVAMDILLESKLISKKTYKSSNGYYRFSMQETHGLFIQEI